MAYDPDEVRERVSRVISDGVAVSKTGREIPMRADCVCVHSDTPGAPDIARAVRAAVEAVQAP